MHFFCVLNKLDQHFLFDFNKLNFKINFGNNNSNVESKDEMCHPLSANILEILCVSFVFLYFHLFSATIHSITIETVRSTVLLFDGDAYFCRWLLRLFVLGVIENSWVGACYSVFVFRPVRLWHIDRVCMIFIILFLRCYLFILKNSSIH